MLSPASVRIYTFMFCHFATWMAEHGLRMSTVDDPNLRAFLDLHENGGRRRNSAIRQRYVRLLQRCFDFLQCAPNPARSTLLAAAADGLRLGKDENMAVLRSGEAASFADALPLANASWKRQRDRAMQLVMLHGGLKVAEVVGVLKSEVARQTDLDGSLVLQITPRGKHPSSHPHTCRLRADAVAELNAWLATRARLGIPGDLVFPANFRGTPLNKATVYRQVKATFARAGLAPSRQGGRTLRNTYAVQELDLVSRSELKEHLGLALTRSTQPYAVAKRNLGTAST